MKTSLYLFIFALTITKAPCQVITVAQDGSGHFQSIQEAIDASQDNDTILVYPGTYFENLNLLGKDLVIGSLNLTSGNPAYIHQTIIDGNHNGACIAIRNLETAHIQGFTITHGSGWMDGLGRTWGGGVDIYNQCDVSIINCLIEQNRADIAGGGINCAGSRLFLSGTTIRYNYTRSGGGGITAGNLQTILAELVFDTINLCNIYLNHAPQGADLSYSNSLVPDGFLIDTFTVSIPTRHHIRQIIQYQEPDDSIRITFNHALANSINQNLYVNPSTGLDQNTGTTAEEPLKTIAYAVKKIDNTEDKELSIFLGEGVYSDLSNGEQFPIGLRSRISIIGSGSNTTILDAMDKTDHLYSSGFENDLSIMNLSMINGNGNIGRILPYGSFQIRDCYNIKFENSNIENNIGYNGAIEIADCNAFSMINCRVNNNFVGKAIRIFSTGSSQFINTSISSNKPIYDSIVPWGGALYVKGTPFSEEPLRVELISSLFTENLTDVNGGFTGSIVIVDNSEAYFINSTIGNNTMINPNTNPILFISRNSKVDMRNSIFYGNSPSSIMLYGDGVTPSELSISHSLIEGGSGTITGDLTGNNLFYDDSNIDTDPLFTGYGDFPYALSGLSPCIDAGTLELPEGITLPATDLAGNPRVWGGSVDMGAYEFNPVTIGESRLQAKTPIRLVAAPNPFVHELSLTVTPKTGVPVRITVHNLLGREVARLLDQTDNRLAYTTLHWNGRGSAGENLPTGAYIISLVEDGNEVETLRVVKSGR